MSFSQGITAASAAVPPSSSSSYSGYSGASQIDQDFWDRVMQDPSVSDDYEKLENDNVKNEKLYRISLRISFHMFIDFFK